MLLFSTIILSLQSFGLASSITELGLVAYGVWVYDRPVSVEYYCGYDYSVCDETVKGHVPDVIAFLMFASVWSTLVTAFTLGVPIWFHKNNGHRHNGWLAPTLIVFYFLTWIFWLAGFADLANIVGTASAGIVAAILAFAIINWLLYTALFIFSFLAIFEVMQGEWPGFLSLKTHDANAASSTVETTNDTGAPVEPKYEGNQLTA